MRNATDKRLGGNNGSLDHKWDSEEKGEEQVS